MANYSYDTKSHRRIHISIWLFANWEPVASHTSDQFHHSSHPSGMFLKSLPGATRHVFFRTDFESQTRREKVLRKGSRWLQWFNICVNFCFLFQDTPFSFHFDEQAGRYVIRSSTRRKVGVCSEAHDPDFWGQGHRLHNCLL